VRVTIADDHAIVREGLRALFEATPDIAVAGEVERADELTPTVTKTRCDVLLLDLQMDRWMMDDIPDLAQLTKVVVLTGSDCEHDLLDALRLGARAIVKKTFAAETIREAIRAVVTGAVWMPADLRDKLTAKTPAEGAAGLSARESDIARYVAVGMRNAEVARKLGITEGTVKVHLNNIFKKLHIRDRVELTLYAIRNRLIGTRGAS
jgi:two-component system, NarL family, nitrate/nitrite response regulator NarL